jgi:thiamine-monophosphate kinase
MTMKHTELYSVGEFGLIDRIRELVNFRVDDAVLHDQLVRGVGDDAAVFHPSSGKVQLLTTDALIEGVHFDLTFTSFKHLGWKAVVSNISDIAAMGGTPRYATIVLSLPQKISLEMVEEFYRGAVYACKKFSCLIVGGDTTTSFANMSIGVTLTGEAEEGKVVYRSGARAGDLLCVSGHLGGSHAGLKVLQREKQRFRSSGGKEFKPDLEPYKFALERYLMPSPRLDLAKLLVDNVRVHAMIDISDGLASEVHHICESSGVGAEVWEHNIPVDRSSQRIAEEFSENVTEYALYGGEEYELLFTLSDEEHKKLERLTGDVTIVGRVVQREKGIELVRENGEREALPKGGWDHFKQHKGIKGA